MINGFKSKEAEKVFNGERSRKLPGDIQQTVSVVSTSNLQQDSFILRRAAVRR